jgi:hypothetical protein
MGDVEFLAADLGDIRIEIEDFLPAGERALAAQRQLDVLGIIFAEAVEIEPVERGDIIADVILGPARALAS